MIQLEKEIEEKLVVLIRRRGGLCLKWVCPGWAGVPDRICLLPGGHIIFIELKRPRGGVLSPRQRWWSRKLDSLGFEYITVWSMKDLNDLDIILGVAERVREATK